jgi:signal transduction histidine kinase
MMTAQDADMTGASPALACPECGMIITTRESTCPTCGVDLALAAAFAEQEVWASMRPAQERPSVEPLSLPRFGDFLLKNGFVTDDQLQAALARQREAAAQGQPPTIGQVLFEMGVVTSAQLDAASVQQVRQLQERLIENNRQLQGYVNRYAQELWQALTKLDELNQLKANFLANIRHELRTPIAHIKGYTDMLALGYLGPISAEQRSALDVINQSTTHLEQLLNDLIRFASSAKGAMTIEPTPFSLNDLAARVIDTLASKAAAKEVLLRAEIPPTLPLVLADMEKIYWVLFHLLDNAIKFTPAGGEVHFTVQPLEKRLRVLVQDTGIGIPPERVREIFEPFHQLDGSLTRGYGGMGLGLALVRRIVELHGAQIEVESQPQRGSIFAFELALAPAAQ